MSTDKPPSSSADASGTPRAETGGGGGRVIKRYSNRKLYDTKESRYVTLLQIGELVRAGEDVRIVDNKTKDDLTEVTLAQIIFEEQKARGRSVPLQTLKELVQSRTEKVLTELREGPIGRLLPGTKTPERPEGRAEPRDEPERPAPEPERESKPRLVDQAKSTFEDWQHRIDDRIRAIVPNLRPWHDLEEEVRQLRTRVTELERKLGTQDDPDKDAQ